MNKKPNDNDNNENIKYFIEGGEAYFQTSTGMRAQIGTPFLRQPNEAAVDEFAAIIGVTGSQRGCVYFSAPRLMLKELVMRMGETKSDDDEILADYIGEVANTIAGNARAHLGSHFLISVPVAIYGDKVQHVRFPPGIPVFVLPLVWNKHMASLIICLKDERAHPSHDVIDFNVLREEGSLV